jgi:hypothetical protein
MRITNLLIAILLSALSACVVYTFSGASVDPNAKNFTVIRFVNNAALVNPNLSQQLTESLKDRILANTTLDFTNSAGDLTFSGEITEYSAAPLAAQANEVTTQSRLTISIRIKYVNIYNEKSNWEKVFTRYADYSTTENFLNIEDQLVQSINTQLAEDIFNKAFINW